MSLHTPLVCFQLSRLLFTPSVHKTLLVNLYASVCHCGVSFRHQQEGRQFIIPHRRVQHTPWNSAAMQRRETGQQEWICYVPADVHAGAKATYSKSESVHSALADKVIYKYEDNSASAISNSSSFLPNVMDKCSELGRTFFLV